MEVGPASLSTHVSQARRLYCTVHVRGFKVGVPKNGKEEKVRINRPTANRLGIVPGWEHPEDDITEYGMGQFPPAIRSGETRRCVASRRDINNSALQHAAEVCGEIPRQARRFI